MARCRATTTKGTRCRNAAAEGSEFCGVHREKEAASSGAGGGARTGGRSGARGPDDSLTTLLGLALVGGIVYLALKLGRRW